MHKRHPGFATIYLLIFSTVVTACGPDQEKKNTAEAATNVASTPTDPLAGKALSQSCIQCHGKDGAQSVHGAPFIAGQQAEYFKAALKAYANGHRSNDEMKSSVAKLSDVDLSNLTAYYSGLKGAWEASRFREQPKQEGVVSKADITKGKKIAGPCLSCHGEDGNSQQTGIPSLAGLQPKYLRSALKSYFDKTRQDVVMQTFSRSIDAVQTRQLSAYLSTLTRTKPIATVSGKAKHGEKYSRNTCDGCHGVNGNSTNPNIPSLSGQNAAYLIKAMQSYRNGTRKNAMMNSTLKQVPVRSFADIAAYYATQQPEKFGAHKPARADKFDPIGEGEALANTCNACHGQHGNSTNAEIPSLTRLYPQYLKTAIAAYASGTRQHALMKSFVSALSEDDIERLGLYYATQDPVSSGKPGKGTAAAGEQIALTCTGCHGEHGNSEQANVPSLAGQNVRYIINALNAYKSGARRQKDMQNVIKELKPADIDNVAAYYAMQSPLRPKVKIPENPIELSAKCDRCHGENGFSAVLNIPRIGGQIESYLVKSLKSYKQDRRTNSAMHAMSDVLSNLEIRAVAKYYSEQTKAP